MGDTKRFLLLKETIMKIDFDAISEERLENFKGGEGCLVAKRYIDDSVTILNGYLEKGSSIGMHGHIGSTETVYVFKGVGKMICDGVEEPMTAGSVSYCPEGHTHSLVNTGDEPLYFMGVVPKVNGN